MQVEHGRRVGRGLIRNDPFSRHRSLNRFDPDTARNSSSVRPPKRGANGSDIHRILDRLLDAPSQEADQDACSDTWHGRYVTLTNRTATSVEVIQTAD